MIHKQFRGKQPRGRDFFLAERHLRISLKRERLKIQERGKSGHQQRELTDNEVLVGRRAQSGCPQEAFFLHSDRRGEGATSRSLDLVAVT